MKKFLNKLFKTLESITRDEPRPSTCCCNHACKCKEAAKESSIQQDNPENTESVKSTSEPTEMFVDFSGYCWKLEDLDYIKNYFSKSPYSYFTKLLGLNDPSFSKIPCFFYSVPGIHYNQVGFHLLGIIIKLETRYYAYIAGGCAMQIPCRESAYNIADASKNYFSGSFDNGDINIMFNQKDSYFNSLTEAKKWLEGFIGYTHVDWCGKDRPIPVNINLTFN